MLSLHAAVLLAACSVGDTVLIDFSADWCGPCRQMEPTVHRLGAAGYPVRKVNIDHDKALAAQFQVQSIPCFVLVIDGREAERTVGATSFEQLLAMFQKHGVTPGAQVKQARGQSPDARAQALAAVAPPASRMPAPSVNEFSAAPPDLSAQMLASSVRLKISDPNGHSYGSGTVISVSGGEALIVTCGHIFRDSQGKGKVVVDMFGAGAPRGMQGRVVGYDLKSDVGLVAFTPGCPVRTAALAAPGHPVRPGETVINIGCNNGAEPTVRTSRITSLDKFLGPPNIQVAGQPVQGRSGGGLFTLDGRVIGICNAADPADNEGLYAALPSIWALLEQHGVTPPAAETQPAALAASDWSAGKSAMSQPQTPTMPQQMPASPFAAAATALDAHQQAALATLASATPGAEVICIVRSLENPRAKGEVFVLDKVSPQFIQQLSVERDAQQQQHPTSLAQRHPSTPVQPAVATRGNVVRNAPIVNVRGGSQTPDWRPNWLRPK